MLRLLQLIHELSYRTIAVNLPVLLRCEVPGSTLRATGLQVDESVSADSLVLLLWKSFSCNMSTLELSSTKPGVMQEKHQA